MTKEDSASGVSDSMMQQQLDNMERFRKENQAKAEAAQQALMDQFDDLFPETQDINLADGRTVVVCPITVGMVRRHKDAMIAAFQRFVESGAAQPDQGGPQGGGLGVIAVIVDIVISDLLDLIGDCVGVQGEDGQVRPLEIDTLQLEDLPHVAAAWMRRNLRDPKQAGAWMTLLRALVQQIEQMVGGKAGS